MNLDLCKTFEVRQTEAGFLVVTPFTYYDGDHVTVFVRQTAAGQWLVTDDGETSLRLQFDGMDTDTPRIQTWLQEASKILGVGWNEHEGAFEVETNPGHAEPEIVEMPLRLHHRPYRHHQTDEEGQGSDQRQSWGKLKKVKPVQQRGEPQPPRQEDGRPHIAPLLILYLLVQ